MDADADPVEVLASRVLVAAVGAGGKRTTHWRLAERHDRAVVTATTGIPAFEEWVADLVETDDPVADDIDADPPEGRRRARPAVQDPDEHEPQIPERADTVLPIASVRVVGGPLDEERVHRPELVGEVADLEPDEPIEPVHVARVLASDRGGLVRSCVPIYRCAPGRCRRASRTTHDRIKRVPEGATVVPVVEMCDDDPLAAIGRRVAEAVPERTDLPWVRLARMDHGRGVEVVE